MEITSDMKAVFGASKAPPPNTSGEDIDLSTDMKALMGGGPTAPSSSSSAAANDGTTGTPSSAAARKKVFGVEPAPDASNKSAIKTASTTAKTVSPASASSSASSSTSSSSDGVIRVKSAVFKEPVSADAGLDERLKARASTRTKSVAASGDATRKAREKVSWE